MINPVFLELDELLGIPFIPPFVPARVTTDNSPVATGRPESVNRLEVLNDTDASEAGEDGALLRDFSDRRQWRPDSATEGARTFGGRYGSLRPKSSRLARVPYRLSFSDPVMVVECARRSQRRRSMFARRHYGYLGYRRVRRTPFSGISCSE